LSALEHQDDHVKSDAALALFVIAQRADSAELLTKGVPAIGNMLNLPNTRLQGAAIIILSSLKPTPPPEVSSLLLDFLKRTDRDPQTQTSAIFALIRVAPGSPATIAAIREFLGRPLGREARIAALNAVGDPRVQDAQTIAIVGASLEDAEQSVRFTAIQALTRMGKHAVQQSEISLRRVANRDNESSEVKDAAQRALRLIDNPVN
jgi:HEAT repeat protein